MRSRGLRQVRSLDRGRDPGRRARQGLAARVLRDDLGRLGAGGNPGPGRLEAVGQLPVEPGLPGWAISRSAI